ncbi:MAG TPA: metallophosphoesterase family protein [Ilumatobacteraceae bacterium]|nr:metallophosphoesterase family protein [Ilumatobacteraceae bacterium]
MTRFFTSDLHFGHANVIGYCGRPFHGVGQMNAAMVAAWNTVVGPDDEVWVLGDLAMGKLDESLQCAAQLVGRKHLVIGNHDRPFRGHGAARYEAVGFELHHGHVELDMPNGVTVVACHFPYTGDSHDVDRYDEHRPADEGRWLLHGHVHERWRQRGRMINVGVDAWGGYPVTDTHLATLIDAGEADLRPLVWE